MEQTDRLTKRDFAAPLRNLLPPRMPSGHPVNRIRDRMLRLLQQVAALRDEAKALLER